MIRCTTPNLSVRYSILPAFMSLTALPTSKVTVPALGFGMRPRGPRTRPSLPTTPIMSGVATAASKSSKPSCDPRGQVLGAHDVRAGLLGLGGLVTLGEHGHAQRLAGAVGQHHGAADLLVCMARVDAQLDVDLHRLVEIGGFMLLQQLARPQPACTGAPARPSAWLLCTASNPCSSSCPPGGACGPRGPPTYPARLCGGLFPPTLRPSHPCCGPCPPGSSWPLPRRWRSGPGSLTCGDLPQLLLA